MHPEQEAPESLPTSTDGQPEQAITIGAVQDNVRTAELDKREATTVGKRNFVGSAIVRGPFGPDKINFALHHYDPSKAPGGDNVDCVLFHSSVLLYGGPFNFMSNFAQSEFQDPTVHDVHTFHCFEQYYQYIKCRYMRFAPVVHNKWRTPIPSDKMADCILLLSNASDCAAAGRSYEHGGEAWESYRRRMWEGSLHGWMWRGLLIKFGQNPELLDLLLKTGDHELVDASKTDRQCGIGYYAHEAFSVGREKWGANQLGKTLMEVRDYFKKEKRYSGGFDAAHFEAEMEKHEALMRAYEVKGAGKKAKRRSS